MPYSYITPTQFENMTLGVKIDDLPQNELQNYLDDAAHELEQWAGWTFQYNASITSTIFGNQRGRIQIRNDGNLYIWARGVFPMNSIASLSWAVQTPALYSGQNFSPSNPVPAASIFVEDDTYGDGVAALVVQDFSPYRGTTSVLQYTMVWNGGYPANAIPMWLWRANGFWAADLLKRRGATSFVVNAFGTPVDPSRMGDSGLLKKAKELIHPHIRTF